MLDQLQQQLKVQRTRHRGSKLGNAAEHAARFLSAYKGIAEIMKGADSQFGPLAYGTLVVFLAVAVNKRYRERIIEETFQSLTDNFGHIEMIQFTHQSNKMQQLMCEAFIQSTEFLSYATNYWSLKSWQRRLKAITDPPQVKLEEKVRDLNVIYERINKERQFIDSQRAFLDNQILFAVHKMGNEESFKSDMQLQHTIAKEVERLRSRVDSSFDDPRLDQLQRYSSDLAVAFDNAKRFKHFDQELLYKQKSFERWLTENKSTLLLLYGESLHSDGDFCWLSECIKPWVDGLNAQSSPYAVYLCKKTIDEEQPRFSDILRSWICQLIQYRDLLIPGEWSQRLDNKTKNLSKSPSNIILLTDVLKHVLDGIGKVYLVLDRSDQIKGDTWVWLDHIVRLMQTADANIHVLLVAETTSGRLDTGGKLERAVFEKLEDALEDKLYHCKLDSEAFGPD